MPWHTKTLQDILPAAFEAASAVKAEAEAGLAKLQTGFDAVNTALTEANAVLTALSDDLAELEQTGFAVITLSPKRGSWSTRLVNAPKAPSTESGLYSCGCFNIFTAATLETASEVFGEMKAALTEKPEIILKDPDIVPFELKKDIDATLKVDEWNGITLGEMMPGVFNAAKNAWNVQKTVVQNLQGMMDRIQKKQRDFHAAIDKADGLISALGQSGFYQYAMEPAVGSWIARAAAETGAPSTFADQYCFGFAAVAVASDLAGAQALYAKLQAVM